MSGRLGIIWQAAIDLYVETYRPILGKSGADFKALWLTCEGMPMRYCTMGETIRKPRAQLLGCRLALIFLEHRALRLRRFTGAKSTSCQCDPSS